MASAIDPTLPLDNVPADKADLRANLLAAKTEIEALQALVSGGGPQVVSVLDHGAVGAGTSGTIVTAEINAAIAAVNALSGRAILYFPPQPSEYRIDASLTAVRTSVDVIMEQGIAFTGTPAAMIVWQIGSESSSSSRVIHRLLIRAASGGDDRYATSGFTGLYLPNLSFSRLHLARMQGFNIGAEIYGVNMGSWGNEFTIGMCHQNTKGIWCGGKGSSGWFNQNRFTGAGPLGLGNDVPNTLDQIGIHFQNRDTGISGNGNVIDGSIGFEGSLSGSGECIAIKMEKSNFCHLMGGRFESLHWVGDVSGGPTLTNRMVWEPLHVSSTVENDIRVAEGTTPPNFRILSRPQLRLATAPTGDLPTTVPDGAVMYDTTLNKVVVRENGVWRQVTTTAI